MRDNLSQTEFIQEPKKYFDLLASKSVEIQDIHPVTDNCVMVTYTKADEYNEGNNISNIAIAAITTSHARLRLLSMLTKLGDRVLYYGKYFYFFVVYVISVHSWQFFLSDTDSVMFISRPGDWMPEEGNCLGEWTNELGPGEFIIRFVSLGPKVYAYDTNLGNSVQKYKGITQCTYTEDILEVDEINGGFKKTGEKLCFDKQKALLEGSLAKQVIILPDSITRNGKTQAVRSVPLTKTLQKVYDKRIMLPDYSTMAYGTRK